MNAHFWRAYFGGIFTVIAIAIVFAGIWQHDPFAMGGIVPAIVAAGCIASSFDKE